MVRRPGTTQLLTGIEEQVGDFSDPEFAAAVAGGASAVVTTVHPMGSDLATQHRIDVEGITRVLLRPPAILGAGASSVWNPRRPAAIRDDERARHAVPEQSFAWVHVDDLATLAADVASGRVASSRDPAFGPVPGACTNVNIAAGPATVRDYHEAVTGALGVEPVWDDAPAWTGQILADRALGWGWTPTVDLTQALAEIEAGLRSRGPELTGAVEDPRSG